MDGGRGENGNATTDLSWAHFDYGWMGASSREYNAWMKNSINLEKLRMGIKVEANKGNE